MRVLDLGAGGNPDIRATDCVELLSKARIDKLTNDVAQIFYDVTKPSKKQDALHTIQAVIEPMINKKKYRYGVNYAKSLPYQDNTFDLIVSHNSLTGGDDKVINAYKNTYRVLKQGGRIEITHGNKIFVRETEKPLVLAGFSKVHTGSTHDAGIFDVVLRKKGYISTQMPDDKLHIITGYKLSR